MAGITTSWALSNSLKKVGCVNFLGTIGMHLVRKLKVQKQSPITLAHFHRPSPLAGTWLFPIARPGQTFPFQSLEDEAVGVFGLPQAYRMLLLPENPYYVHNL